MPEHKGEQKKILVVEDDAETRQLIRLIYSEAGYDILEASDGKQALEMIKNQRPDLIMLDIVMPGMDGIELAKKLAATEDTFDIPRMFVTGAVDRCSSAEVRELVQDVMIKPFDIEEVLEKVKRLISARPL